MIRFLSSFGLNVPVHMKNHQTKISGPVKNIQFFLGGGRYAPSTTNSKISMSAQRSVGPAFRLLFLALFSPLFSPSVFFLHRLLFSKKEWSDQNTYLAKVDRGAPKNLGVDTFPDPISHFWARKTLTPPLKIL